MVYIGYNDRMHNYLMAEYALAERDTSTHSTGSFDEALR